MSFQVSWLMWIVPIVIVGIICKRLINQTRLKKGYSELSPYVWNVGIPVFYFFVVGWFAIFMMHNKSTPIWLHVNTLKFVQFPWRFLTLVILSFSFVIGAIPVILERNRDRISKDAISRLTPSSMTTCIFLIIAVLLYSWNYFLPQHGKLGPLTDTQKFSAAAWDLQQTAGIYDYLPVTAKTAPKAPQKYLAEVGRGNAIVTNPF